MEAPERWLEPERARLETLRSLQADALAWNQNGRDVGFLNHRSRRLVEASALQETERYRERLSALEFDYLEACGAANAAELRRARRVRAAIGTLAVVLIAVVAGWMNDASLNDGLWKEKLSRLLTAGKCRRASGSRQRPNSLSCSTNGSFRRDGDPTDERGVETELRLSHLGTARRKGREQTCSA